MTPEDIRYVLDTLSRIRQDLANTDTKTHQLFEYINQKHAQFNQYLNAQFGQVQQHNMQLQQENETLKQKLQILQSQSQLPSTQYQSTQPYINVYDSVQVSTAHLANERHLAAEAERRNKAMAANTAHPPQTFQRPAVTRVLDSHEKPLLLSLGRSLEGAIKQFSLRPLAVPKDVQQSLQANSSSGLQLEETKQPTPPYYAYNASKYWLLVPNPTMTWPPLMVQQVGLDLLFELRPAKLSAPKKIRQIHAPARMNRSGDNWTVVQQGILEFEP